MGLGLGLGLGLCECLRITWLKASVVRIFGSRSATAARSCSVITSMIYLTLLPYISLHLAISPYISCLLGHHLADDLLRVLLQRVLRLLVLLGLPRGRVKG